MYCLLINCFDKGQLFNPISGITTNQAEGLNRLYKDLQENKELPLDVSVLGFYQLSIFYCNSIRLGYGNSGEYKLRAEFATYYVDPKYAGIRKAHAPEAIIQEIIKDKNIMFEVNYCYICFLIFYLFS